MFDRFTDRQMEKLLSKKVIPPDDEEIYRYGLQQGMIMLLNLATMILLGLLFHRLLECFIFVVAYIPLRSFAGGYHATTPVRCYLLSIIMICTVLWVMGWIACDGLICACLIILSGGLILWLVPVEDKNKPLDRLERVVYRRRAQRIVVMEIIISAFAVFFQWQELRNCLLLVMISMAVMLLLGMWKNKLNHR